MELGGVIIKSSEEVGLAFKAILQRLNCHKDEDYINSKPYGCLHCTHYIRNESYDQQWGMWQFYNCYCELGVKDKYISNNEKQKCCEFNYGNNQLNYVSEEEKLKTEYYASLGYYESKGITFESFCKSKLKNKCKIEMPFGRQKGII